jgi:hypothetical protein
MHHRADFTASSPAIVAANLRQLQLARTPQAVLLGYGMYRQTRHVQGSTGQLADALT